jgi:hypothetical protein
MTLVEQFQRELADAINRNGIDNELDVPDYILAQLLVDVLDAFDRADRHLREHIWRTDFDWPFTPDEIEAVKEFIAERRRKAVEEGKAVVSNG